MNLQRRRAIEFFADHAGYATPPGRMVCAMQLADAEALASTRGWTCTWEWDTDADLGDHAYWCDDERHHRTHEHEVLVCVLHAENGDVLGSLGGIIDPSHTYARVVEAEMAAEAIAAEQCVYCAGSAGRHGVACPGNPADPWYATRA